MLQKRSTTAAITAAMRRETHVLGAIMRKTMDQKDSDRVDHWSQCVGQQVQESDQLSLPSIHHSFVASGRCIEPDAPAFKVENQTPHCKDLGDLKPVLKMYVEVHVHTKAGTNVRANEERDEMTRHEGRRT